MDLRCLFNHLRIFWGSLPIFLIFCACAQNATAAGSGGGGGGGGGSGGYTPVVEAGVAFHTGTSGKSVTGTNGYILNFRSENKKGGWRWLAAFDFEFGKGSAAIGEGSSSFLLLGSAFQTGFQLYPLSSGRFQPFLGTSGVENFA